MDSDGILASDEQGARRELIRQAALAAEGDGKLPRGFVEALFSRVAPEDLAAYSADDLAALAAQSYRHLQDRAVGTAKIRIGNPRSAVAPLKDITVIEIANDDMPFLLDSIMGEIAARGLNVRLVAHPIFAVARDKKDKLTGWGADGRSQKGRRESFIHIHVERIDEGRFEAIDEALASLLSELRVCVDDWKDMLARVQAEVGELKSKPQPLAKAEVSEAADFLGWLIAGNFTFLGCREYRFTGEGEETELEPIFETGLGILRGQEVRVLSRGGRLLNMTPELREFMRQPAQLIITKANARSRIHRRVHMDYIGVKRFAADGALVGELRIVGLFTSAAYTQTARSIPYLRRKVEKVTARAGFEAGSHSGKALLNVLETYPRDELFQIDGELLYRYALLILELDERPRVRTLARRDKFDRFVSILVYVPRDRYDSTIRARLGDYFAEIYKGRVSAFHPFFGDGPLTRVHFIIGRDEGETPNPDRVALETAVEDIIRDWNDGLARALSAQHDGARAQALAGRYAGSFSAAYREAFDPETAVADIRTLEQLSRERPVAIKFYRRYPAHREIANLKVWCLERPLPLSARVPVLEHMGFEVIDERTYPIESKGAESERAFLHDMTLGRKRGGEIDLGRLSGALEAALMAIVRGRAEDDGFNELTLSTGMAWRDVALVRTLARYLRQAGIPYSQDYLWATLNKHPRIAEKLVALFHLRFDPRIETKPEAREKQASEIEAEIEAALGAVESLDEDRILREFRTLVSAAIRTNFYQIDARGHPKQTIAIKFESRRIGLLPLPKPLYEIFVYSPRVEGVHLRFGKVARGGIRWSDRPQDFRTEILGLVKAQQVKNAVIVPVGAKGGFVPKTMPLDGGRDAVLAEGTAAYKIFIASLLDLTDNIGPKGEIVHPENAVRYDDDDPYLVVAADKGTATFSDIANQIAIEHGFWLGDAFASGGSVGYDHKKMGITARGAWESVKRHFREMDVDIHETPFTVAGVGDMSGDVFGNGMLLENTIKLVAAFDHRDIFLDPSPDPVRSLAERRRLFDLPRSSWRDYDKELISTGGGVFPRSLKSVPLSDETRAQLDLQKSEATPTEVIRAILKMPVDLLWFGGIGTYVRASAETDDKAGDRANDAVRIAASELRCNVIGEGANLGMTQRGRIEAALRGVRLNTDAIDNSAGVNTSDMEVNIKIALSRPVGEGSLSEDARNALLPEMTDDVAQLVLRNNYLQTLALSLAQRQARDDLGFEQRLIEMLEGRHLLDRAVEFLPSDTELAERRKRGLGLTRPELAVTLAYAKLTLYSDLLSSPVPDDPYLGRELVRYFPKLLTERFPDAVQQHRLKREIIATMLANSIINRGGPSFIARVADETDAEVSDIAGAFAAVRDSYRMTELNGEIDALDSKIPGKRQLELYAEVQNLLLDRVIWFIRNTAMEGGLAGIVSHYRKTIEAMEKALDAVLTGAMREALHARIAALAADGVPEPLARRIAQLPRLAAATDITLISDRTKKPAGEVAATYFAAREYLQIDGLIAAARAIETEDRFDRLALDRAIDSISASERMVVADMLSGEKSGASAVEAWVEARASEVARVRGRIREIAGSGFTLSRLVITAGLLRDLVKD